MTGVSQTAGVKSVVSAFVDAAERRDWPQVKLLLHPYLHWIESQHAIRGRNNVLAHLATGPALRPPASFELRDGQIYRWTSS